MARRRGGGLLGVLALLAVLGGAAWLFRDRIPGPWSRGQAQQLTDVSEATAGQAEAKLQRLRDDGEEAALSSAEVTSLLRYRLRGGLAERLHDPTVTFQGEQVRVTGRIPTEQLPDVRELRAVRGFLPDTADVSVQGTMRPLEGGRAAMKVSGVSFAGVPVPQEVYASALQRLGRQDEPGLAPDEYAVRLPPGVGGARVQNGQLVLSPAAQ